MSVRQRVASEIKAIGLVALYFASWFGLMILLKRLVLAEHQIEFGGLSIAIVGVLIVAKVVVAMEHVPLGQWTRRHPAALDVALRTLLYALGVLIANLLEVGFETRHEAGGFVPAITSGFRHGEIHHALATTIGVTVALLIFNVHSVLQRYLGERQLSRLFFTIPLAELEAKRAKTDSSPTTSTGDWRR